MANFKEISNPCPVGWSSGLKDLDTYKDHWPHVAFKIGKEYHKKILRIKY